jgi:hypothetical protein
MLKNTFFAKEPWFLKVIYVLAFLGITYNLYLLIFTPKVINPIIQIITSVIFTFFLFRKFLKDKKRN